MTSIRSPRRWPNSPPSATTSPPSTAAKAPTASSYCGQLTQLTDMITTINRTLSNDTVAVARWTHSTAKSPISSHASPPTVATVGKAERVTSLARRPPGGSSPQTNGGRPLEELEDWVEHVYRPGYGHLAAVLGGCWTEHDLCLYGLDIASQLWCALYLQPERSASLLSAQAEYQGRILPALAAQLAAETTRCRHTPTASRRGAQ